MALQTSSPSSARAWVLQNPATGDVDFSNSRTATFALKSISLPATVPPDALLVQTLYLSNDPAQRLWIEAKNEELTGNRADMSGVAVGSPMKSFGIARVLAVGGDDSDDFKPGDLVMSTALAWSEYYVVEKSTAKKLRLHPGLSPSVFLGVLGFSGQSAYWCLVDTLEIKPSDTLVVSGAAGSLGNIVVQYAKRVLGVSHVVAIAGSDEKCEWLKGIGADAAINYKSPTFAKDLKEAAPKGVDKFFDNVGGPILDTVIANMNPHGIVGVCGLIASYGTGADLHLKNFGLVLLNRLFIKGYTVMDYIARFPEAEKALGDAIAAGKLESFETLVDLRGKFEEVPKIWHWLFEGKNTGKLVTKLAD